MIKKRKEQLIEQSNYFENNQAKSPIPEGKFSKHQELSIFNNGLNSNNKQLKTQTLKQNFRIVNDN